MTEIEGPVVYTEPAFPSIFDTVTVFFDATEGNAALAGFTGTVYAHTGLITDRSTNGTDWKHVVGNWGTADARTKMTRVSDDLYSLTYHIESYYGIPQGEEVLQMAFVFRNESGTVVGRATDGSDIFVDVFPPDQGLLVTWQSPDEDALITLGDSLLLQFEVNDTVEIDIFDDDQLVFSQRVQDTAFWILPSEQGSHTLRLEATSTDTILILSRTYFVLGAEQIKVEPPAGTVDGFNYFSDSSYLFRLFAPGKESVFLLTPQNNYQINEDYLLHPSDNDVFLDRGCKKFFSRGTTYLSIFGRWYDQDRRSLLSGGTGSQPRSRCT